MYVCMYVCVYVCVCVYIHTHIYIFVYNNDNYLNVCVLFFFFYFSCFVNSYFTGEIVYFCFACLSFNYELDIWRVICV